jgi:hypothetical protein
MSWSSQFLELCKSQAFNFFRTVTDLIDSQIDEEVDMFFYEGSPLHANASTTLQVITLQSSPSTPA